MPKILFTSYNRNPDTPGILLKAGFEVLIPKEDIEDIHEYTRENLLSNLPADILVINDFKFKIDKEIIDKVKAVFTRTTGLDHIDTDYAKEKGVEVIPLKGEELGDVVAVPELCIGKMIELLRMGTPGYELKGKTLGLIGYGRVSKLVEKYALAFGTRVKWIDNFNVPDTEIFKEDLANVLYSDIVSLHITASEENRNFMDLEKFKIMKEGAFFFKFL